MSCQHCGCDPCTRRPSCRQASRPAPRWIEVNSWAEVQAAIEKIEAADDAAWDAADLEWGYIRLATPYERAEAELTEVIEEIEATL